MRLILGVSSAHPWKMALIPRVKADLNQKCKSPAANFTGLWRF